MSDDQQVFALVSGEYSDYTVHCIFERTEDALSYLAAMGVTMEVVPVNELCPGGDLFREVGDSFVHDYGWRVEPFQFWRAGEVPHVEAK